MLSDYCDGGIGGNTGYDYNGTDKMVQRMKRRVMINIMMMMMMIILVMMIKGIYKGDVIGNYSRTSDS